MGLREANQNFSKAIKAVKAGQEVVLTERGKPIATIKPLKTVQNGDAAVRRLENSRAASPGSKNVSTPRLVSPAPERGAIVPYAERGA